MNFKSVHTFKNISLVDYERLFFDEAFNQGMKMAAGLKKREVLEERNEGGRVFRRIKVWPERDFPAVMKKFMSGEVTYTEENWFDPARHHADWKSITSMMSDKLSITGIVAFTQKGDLVQREVSGEVKVAIFGIGKVVEKAIVDNLHETHDKIAQFTQQWIDQGKAK